MKNALTAVLTLLALVGLVSPSEAQSPFAQGVASGDVTDTTAMIWTRATPPGEVRLEIASDQAFSIILQSVSVTGSPDSDGTVKVDVDGLTPATLYFYRFVDLATAAVSPLGSFRTVPAADAARPFRFVYTGDSNAAHQPFEVLGKAAQEQPDIWFWAGDTAYADGVAGGIPRASDLEGYRAKHLQNRNDPFLQTLLGSSAAYVQWDDHEVANDYDGGDLEAHITEAQRQAGYRAFFDYMPIRPQDVAGDESRIYRSVRYGSLAEFFILDCRQYRSRDVGREGGGPDPRAFLLPTLEIETITRLADPARSMLGAEQLAWLKNGLKNSTATWKFVLSSVPFTSLLFIPYDRWDGYVAERYDLLRYIDVNGITGVVLMSADIHASVYNPDVTYFLRNTIRQEFSPCFKVPEIIAGPIATDTLQNEIGDFIAGFAGVSGAEFRGTLLFGLGFDFLRNKIIEMNGLRFVEPNKFGYAVIDVSADAVNVTWRGIEPDSSAPSPQPQTLHTAVLPDAQANLCGQGFLLPICAMAVIPLCTVRRYGRRASMNG
ncbi:MAG: alkaline phosphatase D family protein [Planctomycetia bacterium]|nr:alkaline phosphatase D family protein [Planctomycetia bacterium]MCC7314296.1 alkaline phosphatase D family protein [Planctomycetota bacterium]OQZ05214.1 MAG: hypothetical protein B6D36_11350 [Planctomycetes bacterium UTPLA1]